MLNNAITKFWTNYQLTRFNTISTIVVPNGPTLCGLAIEREAKTDLLVKEVN